MTETIVLIIALFVIAVIFSEYESKTHKQMKRKRPCRFVTRKFTPSKSGHVAGKFNDEIVDGLFHQFGTSNQLGKPSETVAIVEDVEGNVHKVDPATVQFLDK